MLDLVVGDEVYVVRISLMGGVDYMGSYKIERINKTSLYIKLETGNEIRVNLRDMKGEGYLSHYKVFVRLEELEDYMGGL